MGELQHKLNILNARHGAASSAVPGQNSENTATLSISREAWIDDSQVYSRNSVKSKDLEDCLPCSETAHSREFLRFHRNINDFWPGSVNFQQHFQEKYSAVNSNEQLPSNLPPDKICFLDIETTGFRGCPLFLIGTGFFREKQIQLEQFFARKVIEEAALLQAFSKAMESFDLLVTFNGKSFDWPFIEDRCAYYDIPLTAPAVHLDLLHYARKNWSDRSPDCKLQTLEKYLFGRRRVGDLPGSKIPAAYQAYIDNPEDTADMADAIHHNALDVLTMFEMAGLILGVQPVTPKS